VRIVHVTDTYLPRLGGIELHVHDLVAQQRLLGHDAVVLTRAPTGAGPDGPLGEPDDVPVVRLRRTAGAGRLTAELAAADVVHCHSSVLSPLAWTAARRAPAAGVPVVVTMHSVVQDASWVRSGLRAVVAAVGPDVTWAAVSTVAATALQPLVPRPVLVLPNGIDPAAWTPRAGADRPPAGAPVTIVTAGRFAARKRVLPFVDVLADVRRRVGPAVALRAVLVGDGPQREPVRRRLRALRIDGWVDLPGRLTRPQIDDLYAGADIFVAPARLESFGLAALEARCAGLPVVALARAGVGEFVRDGVEGLLAGDDRDLARATAALVTDAALRGRIRAHNASTPTTLGWAHVVDRCLSVYAVAGASDRGMLVSH